MQSAEEVGVEHPSGGSSNASLRGFPGFENKLSRLHARGSVLFTEGQAARGVYFLRSGSIKLSISSAQGRILVLRIVRAGELLGVSSVLRGLPYEATAETLELCRTDFILASEFIAMQAMNREASEFVMHSLSREAYEMTQIARMLLLSETAAEKLACLLLKWCEAEGVQEPRGIRVNNTFTQEEISHMICTSRETVTRLLGEFGKRQLIRMIGNIIVIRNREGLEEIVARSSDDHRLVHV